MATDDKRTAPTVIKHEDAGKEMFEIVHGRYVSFARDPSKEGRTGYIGREVHHTMDEGLLRSELKTFFELDDSDR